MMRRTGLIDILRALNSCLPFFHLVNKLRCCSGMNAEKQSAEQLYGCEL